MSPAELLHSWLKRQLQSDAAQWLEQSAAKLADNAKDKDLYLAVSLVPRKLGKADLALREEDFREAERSRPHWNPSGWSVDQAGRLMLMLSARSTDDEFARRLEQLCITADVGELVAFYRGLPLYPDPPRYVLRAAEGIRSNMRAVFEAVAHRNPYPSEQLSENAWNQMVLKALFVGATLAPIAGLDERANATLARMLCDYAHERWAASRPVSPELWRCVGPYANDAAIADLERVFKTGTELERAGAALAMKSSEHPQAARLLQSDPGLAAMLERRALTWQSVVAG